MDFSTIKSDNVKPLKNENTGDIRKVLKVKILQLQADKLQEKMDGAMNDIEHMAQEYTTLMAELKVLKGVSESQNDKHIELLSRMIGDKETVPVDYSTCNTSEEMLQLVMDDLGQVKKLEAKMKEQENTALPDVGDNSEIWDRIALAQKAVNEEDEKKKLFDCSPSRPPTPSTDFESDSDTPSLGYSTYVDEMANSLVV
jgi:hypothetical protein